MKAALCIFLTLVLLSQSGKAASDQKNNWVQNQSPRPAPVADTMFNYVIDSVFGLEPQMYFENVQM